MTTLKIGTRGSPLALAQAFETRDRLMAAHGLPEEAFSIRVISVSGDRILDRPLSQAGGKGLFTKEIEEALLAGAIDIAVHSSKDMPTGLPHGLELSAFLPREDPRDAFVGREAQSIAQMPRGATIGTSSLRRQALILRMRPDLQVITFRGNVQTRLRKLQQRIADATLLALSGLRRLGMESAATDVLPLDSFPPAPGQGAICIESRTGDDRVGSLLQGIHHRPTGEALACERAFLASLDGSCRTPIAGHAVVRDGWLRFSGLVLKPDGSESYGVETDGPAAEGVAIGTAAGADVRARAGKRFFSTWEPQGSFSRALDATA